MDPGGDSVGACFGDSEGPVLLGVNSYVTRYNRSGAGYSARIDTPEIPVWIQSFLD